MAIRDMEVLHMRFAALVPIGLFVVFLGILGVRLLLLARRTRELPEICLGFGLVFVALVGTPLAAIGRIPATVGTPLGHLVFAIGMLVVVTGLGLLFVFTWRTFRPNQAWARSLACSACLGLSVVGFGISYAGSQASEPAEILSLTRGWALGIMAMVALNFAWSGIESISYYRLYRRRLALEMADPVLVNRFFLWGVSALGAALLCAGLALCLLARLSVLTDALPVTLIAATGSVMCVSWSLTFFPPSSYQGFLRRRAHSTRR